MGFEAHPVTKERWPDLVELFDRPIVRTCFSGVVHRVLLRRDMFFGAKSMYDRAGFREVARRKPTRPVVRRSLRGGRVDQEVQR